MITPREACVCIAMGRLGTFKALVLDVLGGEAGSQSVNDLTCSLIGLSVQHLCPSAVYTVYNNCHSLFRIRHHPFPLPVILTTSQF